MVDTQPSLSQETNRPLNFEEGLPLPSRLDTTSLPWKGSVAEHFARFRHPIPAEVVDLIYDELKLKHEEPVLDFGCGTGLLARELITRSSIVRGIDVSEDMLHQAEITLAGHPQRNHIILSDCPLSRLVQTEEKFKAAMICRAFFAMPREVVIEQLDRLIEIDGAIVIIEDPNFYRMKEPWQRATRHVCEEHFTSRELPPLPCSHQDVLHESTFSNLTEHVVDVVRTWTIEQVIGVLYSTGFVADASNYSADLRQKFEDHLTRELLELFPSGTWDESAQFEVIIARREGSR